MSTKDLIARLCQNCPSDRGADSIRTVHPLFQAGDGGSNPTSALQLHFARTTLGIAVRLNELWHSRLPLYRQTGAVICYAASCENRYYASAIWAQPSSAEIDQSWLELKRLAIAPDSPKNTASRMLGFMVRDIRRRFPSVPRLISYQDPQVHTGTIYKAAGWQCAGSHQSGGFASAKVRYRPPDQACGDKIRWEYPLVDSPSAGPAGGTSDEAPAGPLYFAGGRGIEPGAQTCHVPAPAPASLPPSQPSGAGSNATGDALAGRLPGPASGPPYLSSEVANGYEDCAQLGRPWTYAMIKELLDGGER